MSPFDLSGKVAVVNGASALVEDPATQKWLSSLPAGRAGQPHDMVAGVLYLASDQAAYTTGTTLVMDGGATLG